MKRKKNNKILKYYWAVYYLFTLKAFWWILSIPWKLIVMTIFIYGHHMIYIDRKVSQSTFTLKTSTSTKLITMCMFRHIFQARITAMESLTCLYKDKIKLDVLLSLRQIRSLSLFAEEEVLKRKFLFLMK